MNSKQEYAARKAYMAEYREERRKTRTAKTEIYDKSNLIYKYAFDKNVARVRIK